MPSGVPNGRSSRSIEPARIASSRARGLCLPSGTPMKTCATPQRIAMIASVMKTAAVSPAATWPPRAAEVASDTAPTPSASVETPITATSAPQTTKRMETKSTCVFNLDERFLDGDAQVDADRSGLTRRHAEAAGSAVGDTRGHGDVEGVVEELFAEPGAARARFGPRLAAAAAARTGAAGRHRERQHAAGERFARRERQLGFEEIVRRRLAGKRGAHRVEHPLDHAPGRRKIDRDLVDETLVRHAPNIGAGPREVKIALRRFSCSLRVWRTRNARCAAARCR